MSERFTTLCCVIAFAIGNQSLHAASVLTYRNDNARDGLNFSESTLTPGNVGVNTFSKRYTTSVDGAVYAQPLYIPNITVNGGAAAGVHNLVIVATQHDSLYALDANTGAVVWHDSFLATNLGIANATSVTSVPSGDTGSTDTSPEIGICSTPVIDPGTNMLFCEAKTKQIVNGNTSLPHYVHTLYQIDITNGNATANANIVNSFIFADTAYDGTNYTFRTDNDPTATDQDPFVVGNAGDAITVNGQSRVYFNGLRQMNRPGLMLLNGVIYLAFASHGDNTPYHGWVLGFDESTLALKAVFNTTPNGGLGGIWGCGGGLACDAAGNIYVVTGNGIFDGNNTGGTVTGLNGNNQPNNGDYSDSYIKLTVDGTTSQGSQNLNGWGLAIADYFSPYNNQSLSSNDSDVGSGGCLILPDSVGSGTHQQLMIGGGKQGILYLIDRNGMGAYGTSDQNVLDQSISGGIFDTPAFFNGTIYVAGMNDNGRAFSISNGTLTGPTTTPDSFAWPGAQPSVSANGTTNAVVWMVDHGSSQLRAYSADLQTEYWTSATAPAGRDSLGTSEKFCVPTVADGSVFVGTTNALVAYGLTPVTPTITTSSATSIGTTSVTLNGTVNPKSVLTTVSFNYGTTTSYGSTTSTQNAGSGTAASNFAINVSNLSPGTPYHFQAVATNGMTTAVGADKTFTTIAEPTIGSTPTVYPNTFGDSIAITVNPNGESTSVSIQYGTDTNYSSGSTTPQSIGSGTSNVTTNVQLPSLPADQTYHYRIVTTGPAGTYYGSDQTFTTPGINSTLMAAKGDPAPGVSGATFATFGNPITNAGNYIAFKGTMTTGAGGITSADATGIWADDHTGTLQLIAQVNGAAVSSTQFTSLSDPVYNDNEAVAFCATGITVTGHTAIAAIAPRPISSSSSGDFTTALGTSAGPGGPGGSGTGTGSGSGSGSGSSSGTSGALGSVWCNSTGTLALVAQQGGAAPGCPGATFATFTQIALPNQGGATNQGGVIMLATLNTNKTAGISTANNLGIWVVDSSGTLDLVVRTGDIVNGKTIKGLSFLPSITASVTGQGRSVSQTTGSLVYLATFTDSSTAIITASF